MSENKYNNFHGRMDEEDRYSDPNWQYYYPDQNPYRQRPNHQKEKGIPLFWIVAGFFVNPVLGLGLLVAHLCMTEVITNKKPGSVQINLNGKEKEFSFRNVTTTTRTETKTTTRYKTGPWEEPPIQDMEPTKKPEAKAPIQDMEPTKKPEAKAPGKVKPKGKWIAVFLTVLGALFALGGVGMVVDAVSWMLSYEVYASDIQQLVWGLLTAGGGLFTMFTGFRMRRDIKVRTRLLAIVGTAPVKKIQDIARSAGLSMDKCIKQLEGCVDQGLFGPGAYLDYAGGNLVTSRATPQQRREAGVNEPPVTQEEVKAASSQYQAILDQLQDLDDAIPGQEMSRKIRELSKISRKIFKLAEEDPDKLPRLRKFMDYYLPTALKLLTSYSQLDAQGVEGENITQAKEKIENAMDSLITAFEAQLDKLFAEDTLDISSDIAAMEGMLRMDGLTGDEDFNLGEA